MECAICGRNDFGNLGVHVCSTGNCGKVAIGSEIRAARREFDTVFDAPIADSSITLTLTTDGELRGQQQKSCEESFHAQSL